MFWICKKKMKRYGNNQQRSVIEKLLKHHHEKQQPLFVLLLGPAWIGKASFLSQILSDFLWDFQYQDLLWIRDCTSSLGKYHTLPVEMPSIQKTIPLESGEVYENKGVREITNWLQQSAFSGKKCLLIENLERMSSAAMNAFLKSCEEPLNNRYIFATVSDEATILSTIFSRALVVRFSPLSDHDMKLFLQEQHLDLSGVMIDLLVNLSGWRVWLVLDLLKKRSENPDFDSFISSDILKLWEKSDLYSQIEILKKAEEFWLLEQVIDMMIMQKSKIGDDVALASRIEVKKMRNQNINEENLLRYWLLS